jgi:hypothetical protein
MIFSPPKIFCLALLDASASFFLTPCEWFIMKFLVSFAIVLLACCGIQSCCASKSVEAPPKPTYQAPHV